MLSLPIESSADGELLRDVVFSIYGSMSANAEMKRRLLSPLAAARVDEGLRRAGRTMAPQAINLAEERFIVYVPQNRSDRGYGLLVFIPPWQDARLPEGWARVLDRFGVIFVSAARSGNDENVSARREPLALLAAENLKQRYLVDPERVYVGGFSGGSRIALRLALGYPDLFRGAFLNAGSDPIGSADLPLPPRELFQRFQISSHLVLASGALDAAQVIDDQVSARSMRQWCVVNVDAFEQPRIGHEVASATALLRSLGILAESLQPVTAKLAACRSTVDDDLDSKLRRVESLINNGHTADARKQLDALDERYGGMAIPRSVDLASRL